MHECTGFVTTILVAIASIAPERCFAEAPVQIQRLNWQHLMMLAPATLW